MSQIAEQFKNINLNEHPECLMATAEVAEELGCSYAALMKRIQHNPGKLMPVKTEKGRKLYKRKDVIAFKEMFKESRPRGRTGPRGLGVRNTNLPSGKNELLNHLLRTKKLIEDEVLSYQKAHLEVTKLITLINGKQ